MTFKTYTDINELTDRIKDCDIHIRITMIHILAKEGFINIDKSGGWNYLTELRDDQENV